MNSKIIEAEIFSANIMVRTQRHSADNKIRPDVKWEALKEQTKMDAIERSVAIKREERIK